MSRLSSRIAALEKKKANQQPKVIGFIGGPYSRMIEDPDRPGHLIWPEPPGGYAAFAKAQQDALLARCVAFNAELDAKESEAPISVGTSDQLAPLKDGQKRAKYIFGTDEKGRDWQLEIASGTRTLV